MAYRSRTTEVEERDYYGRPRRGGSDVEEIDYSRRSVTRSPPGRARGPVREYDEVDVRVREREGNRAPAFLREDARRADAGPMVLRQREVETFDRVARSPSPVRERPLRRPRSVSPPPFQDRDRGSRTMVVEEERIVTRSPSTARRRSPSPRPRYARRRRSPSVDEEHIRIIERERERIPSPSPSPSPSPPPFVRGPTIEREVITHYRDVNHGMVSARPPSPPPAPRQRPRERETDIDISLSKNRTEVDIHKSSGRRRSKSRERRPRYEEDEVVIQRDGDRLRVEEFSTPRRRARSAVPLASPADEESEFISSRIDSRGRMGEALGGATRDWSIVDVPPGTERVHMDGVGGGATDTTWTQYSGVRRTKFLPERDGMLVPRERDPSPVRERERERDRLSVAVNTSGYDREREIDIVTDRRITRSPLPPPPPPQPVKEMWTEITKDLVTREAIIEMGYDFEETPEVFYVMNYLKYDDVLQLTQLSEDIRRARKDRVRELQYERGIRERFERPRPRRRSRPRSGGDWDNERVVEREVVYDSRGPVRGYIR